MDDTSTLLILCSYIILYTTTSIAADTINTTQSIRDGETIVSASEIFRLGFFSPGNSKSRFLGIWYNKVSVKTVVWVGNRKVPITDSSCVLKISAQGILVLVNHNETIIWSSNSMRAARNPVAQVLDSGNLIVKDEGDEKPENYLWRSFDYPSDIFLPEMKLGWNRVTGLGRYISSWKTHDNPSPGNFTFVLDPGGYPEITIREGSILSFQAGPWNGLRFCGTPVLKPNPVYTYGFVLNEKECYYYYQLRNSIISRIVINQNGYVQRFNWIERTQTWETYLSMPTDNCDRYAYCGAHGTCNINNSPVCSCLRGFEPKVQKEWEMLDWSSGCVIKTPLNCSEDGFLKYSSVKVPETRKSWFDKSMNVEGCRITCLKNCSCTAYTNLDITGGGSGCLLLNDDLIDIREYDENGQDIYVRMATSEIENDMKTPSKSNAKNRMKITVSSGLSAGTLFLGLTILLYVWKKKQQEDTVPVQTAANTSALDNEGLELPLFDFATISCATNNFSTANKLGEGGFGPVFKGTLENGQEIAVKRLSMNSKQGLDKFKNEVMHIAKLQHRNLVKLLGCSVESEEKMLIYEFMPNKSLDFFIFDKVQSTLLDWPKRYQIINGIARGLLYLHQDSRLRIIHRDLKAGNILLDYEMNPKISDFGLARSFKENETKANTNKVVGTYGYMSPEYAYYGIYSVKSDVYSFGVITLEIVSGKRNRVFFHQDYLLDLLGHAWRLHKVERSIEIIDASLRNFCNVSEVLRSVHIGLLCVHRNLEDRPSVSVVVFMLGSEGAF